MRKNMRNRTRGFMAAGVALITCPCHFILILPLILSFSAGTAAGAFFERNYYSIIAVSIVAFIGGLILAIRWLGSGGSEDRASSSGQSQMRLNESSHIGSLQQKE